MDRLVQFLRNFYWLILIVVVLIWVIISPDSLQQALETILQGLLSLVARLLSVILKAVESVLTRNSESIGNMLLVIILFLVFYFMLRGAWRAITGGRPRGRIGR